MPALLASRSIFATRPLLKRSKTPKDDISADKTPSKASDEDPKTEQPETKIPEPPVGEQPADVKSVPTAAPQEPTEKVDESFIQNRNEGGDEATSTSSSSDSDSESDNDNDVLEGEVTEHGDSTGDSALVSTKAYWPEELMVIPLAQRPVVPETGIPVHISDEHLLSIVQNNFNRGRKYVGLFYMKKDFRDEKASVTDAAQIHDIGVIGQIVDIKRDLTGHALVHCFGLQRVKIENSVPNRPVLTVKVKLVQNKMPHPKRSEYIKAYVHEILKVLTDLIKNQPLHRDFLVYLRQHMDDNPARTADYAAASTTASGDELQEVLECIDVDERLAKGLLLLKKELDLSNFQRSVAKQIEEKMSTQQRNFMLNEQLKLIKKELGMETDEKEQLVTKYRERVKDINPPKHAVQVINDELNKLSSLDPNSSEFNITRNYLEWLTVLPWNKLSTDSYDLAHATKVLDEDHYGLDDLKTRIMEFIAVGKLMGSIQGKILCLVGPPGVGKTSIGKSVARSVNREFYRFSVGGMSDVAEIKGHRRTYVGAMPGKLIQCLKMVKTSNPVVLIDEIDKLSKGYSGDPASALLEVLDPEQNKNFLDHYLDVPYDLSKVLFICTANSLDTIPKPLLDRMEILRISGYVLEEKMKIASRYLVPEAIKESGLKSEQVEIGDEVLGSLARSYCREAGVRNLKQHVDKIARKIAYKVAKGEAENVIVTPSNLEEFVGKPVFSTDRFYDELPVGVVTGLAWTAMGGATLYIETVALPLKGDGSKGRLQTTGQMGDVMKESSVVCYTFAKKYLLSIDAQNNFFDQNDIHLHIPEGATPKDGPSAGVTMVTALLSQALDRKVSAALAMTGEISLTGKVLKIGGVKEKIIAAKRSEATTVILPIDNQRDFEELPEFIRKDVTIHYARDYGDVFKVALGQ